MHPIKSYAEQEHFTPMTAFEAAEYILGFSDVYKAVIDISRVESDVLTVAITCEDLSKYEISGKLAYDLLNLM